MKQLFTFIFLFCSLSSTFGQKPASELNECEFFEYLKLLSKNNYQNDDYGEVYNNFHLRSNLLKKLESYLIVFANDDIAPMYLNNDTVLDKRACPTFVKLYHQALTDSKVQSARNEVQKDRFINIRHLLINLCELDKENNYNVALYLAEFEHPFTIEYLYYDTKDSYFGIGGFDPMYKLPQIIKEQNLQFLSSRMNKLDNSKYIHFETYNSKPNFFKGFEMYHDNDVFIIIPGMNQDRELTGGFGFTIITDYFKWRWMRIGNKKKDNVLSYQTISLVGSGYTPYIR